MTLRRKRRTHAGRVQQERIKPKAGAKPTKLEKWHIARVRALRCLISGEKATVHHVTGYADRPGRFSRSHRLVVPLAQRYHQTVADPKAADPISVEGLGHQGFYRKYGIDLLAVAERLWADTEAEGAKLDALKVEIMG